MKLVCPKIPLPDYYTYLLQQDLSTSEKTFENIGNYIKQNPSLESLVGGIIAGLDPNIKPDQIIQQLGWDGFRNKLAGIFLFYAQNNRFPESDEIPLPEKALEFERRVRNYCVSGNSRSFLLGLYLSFASQIEEIDSFEGRAEYVAIDQRILDLLEHSKTRSQHIDWILIILWHLVKYLGYDVIQKHIKDNKNYHDLIYSLSEDDRSNMIDNLLSYGMSINEPEVFYSEMV